MLHRAAANRAKPRARRARAEIPKKALNMADPLEMETDGLSV